MTVPETPKAQGTPGPSSSGSVKQSDALLPLYLARRHVEVYTAAAAGAMRGEQKGQPIGRQARLLLTVLRVDRRPEVDGSPPRLVWAGTARHLEVGGAGL